MPPKKPKAPAKKDPSKKKAKKTGASADMDVDDKTDSTVELKRKRTSTSASDTDDEPGSDSDPTATPKAKGATTSDSDADSEPEPDTAAATATKRRKVVVTDDDDAADADDLSSYEWVKYGGGQSETWHFVPKAWKDKVDGTKLQRMYAGSAPRAPRSYGSEREKQALRWLSTALFAKFTDAVEIQAYYDRSTETIYVSSNKNAVNKELLKFLTNFDENKLPKAGDERQTRHHAKLLAGLKAPKPDQKPIFDAIKAKKFKVPTTDETVDLHAERRIEKELAGRTMDDTTKGWLGGVKRPCAVCAVALQLASSRPGPRWTSGAAMHGYTKVEIEKWFADHKLKTHTTQTKGAPTTGHDTDSDSDADT